MKNSSVEKSHYDELLVRHSELEADELQSGKPKVGWICLRSPVEMIEALGAIPIRILPGDFRDDCLNDSIKPDGCSFCRQALKTIHQGREYGLTAVIGGHTCDQMRRMIDTANQESTIPVHLISFPRTHRSESDPYFVEMIRQSYQWLAGQLGAEVVDGALESAIQARQELYMRVNELRRSGGIDTKLVRRLAASPLPARLLLEMLEKTKPVAIPLNKRPRLAILGSIIDDSIFDTIEREGGEIVFDGSCQGNTVFRETELHSNDPFEQLYQRYGMENICPHRRPIEPFLQYIESRVAEANVDGVILVSLMHCHPWGQSVKLIKDRLHMPFLHLEEESGAMVSARTSTRVAAFLEMLALKRKTVQ